MIERQKIVSERRLLGKNLFQGREEYALVLSFTVQSCAVLQALARNRHHIARNIQEITPGNRRLETFHRNGIAKSDHIVHLPVCGELVGCGQRLVVIEQTDPEGRQRTDAPPWAAIGTAHFQKTLEAHIGEER